MWPKGAKGPKGAYRIPSCRAADLGLAARPGLLPDASRTLSGRPLAGPLQPDRPASCHRKLRQDPGLLVYRSSAMRCAPRHRPCTRGSQPVGQPSGRGRQWRRDRTEVVLAKPIAGSNQLTGGSRAQSRRYLESESGCLRCKGRGSRASARTRYLECVFAVAAVSTGGALLWCCPSLGLFDHLG